METKRISSKDIVIVGQQPWDTEIGSNCKNIALEFSKRSRVLYVNCPVDRITAIRQRKDPKVRFRIEVVKGSQNGLVRISDNLWNYYPDCIVESINWISNKAVFNALNRRNNKRFSNSIDKALSQLGFRDFVLFNDNEILKCFYLKELLRPSLAIYYSRDYILATPYWKKHGGTLEPETIRKYDLCLTNSTYLEEYCKQFNANSFNVGQGCDLEFFKASLRPDRPTELENIKCPIIGYVGALLVARLDIALIKAIAKAHADCKLVLVGPEDLDFQNSELHHISNILFIGPRAVTELPAFISHFDVCINPQITNKLTIGNYPRKIDEYLAFGKPVVATATLAMDVFRKHVYLANSHTQFIQLLSLALSDKDLAKREARIEFATSHSWQNNIQTIYEVLDDFWKSKGNEKTIN